MSWQLIENSDGHSWEIDEATQEFRLDGQIVPGSVGIAKMLKEVWKVDLTPDQANQVYQNYLDAIIGPGSGKTSL